MRPMKNIIILLAISIASPKTCDGYLMAILKAAQIGYNIYTKIDSILEPFLNQHEESTTSEYDVLNEQLSNLTFTVEYLQEEMTNKFQNLFYKVDQTPNKAVSLITADRLESCIINMENELGKIVLNLKKIKSGSLVKDDYNLNKLKRFSDKIDQFKTTIRSIIKQKSLAIDYLSVVKDEATNVCDNRMSQLQVLDSFRALYDVTMTRYLLSEHLIIMMYELLGVPDQNNDKKRVLNEEVQKDFDNDLPRFREIMADASREFQTCTKPTVFYKTGARYFYNKEKNRTCYIIDPNDKMQPSSGTISSMKNPHTICYYYFSLRTANAKPGYVVLGAKIERELNLLYIRIIQGKLLPNGLIDPDSISYNDDPGHGIGDPVVKIWFKDTIIDLTETIVPDDRVITGLGFAKSDKGHVYLQVISKKLKVTKGILIRKTSRVEEHKDGLNPHEVRGPKQEYLPVVRSSIGLQSVEPNQHLKLAYYLGNAAHPYIDGDDIFPTPFSLLSGASLYVREVEGYLGFLSIRLHTFNIVPYIKAKIDADQNFTKIIEII